MSDIPLENDKDDVELTDLSITENETIKSTKLRSFIDYLSQKRIQLTICYYCCFISIGMMLASLGPSLLALGEKTHSDIDHMGYIFSARSVGYLVGSAIGGPMFDHFNGNRLLAVAVAVSVICCFFIPLTPYVYVLAILIISSGVTMGFLDTGGNVSIIWLHGDKVGPYMQGLHFCFGIGSLVAPLFIGEAMHGSNGDPTWGFWIIAILSLPLPVWLMFYSKIEHAKDKEEVNILGKYEKIIIALIGLLLLLDVGSEVCAGGYLYSYAVIGEFMEERTAAFFTSAYWGAFTFGRLVAVITSLYLSAGQMLGISLVGTVISTFILLIFQKSLIALWIGTLLFGFSIASVFPSAIHLAETYMKLTGKIAAVVVVCASLGEMLVPLMVANLFESKGPISLLIVLFVSSIFGLLCFVAITIVGRFTNKHKNIPRIDSTEKEGGKFMLIAEDE